jgi:hypothetical protein
MHPLDMVIYDTEQVAQSLNLSVWHILRVIRLGKLETKKIGKQ